MNRPNRLVGLRALMLRCLLLLAAIASIGWVRPEYVTHDHVDVIELNHFFSDAYHSEGVRRQFSQLVFWKDNNVVDYVIVARKSSKSIHDPKDEWMTVGEPDECGRQFITVNVTDVIITRDPPSVIFTDRGVLRKVTANAYHETFSTYDREVSGRDMRHERQGLLNPGEAYRRKMSEYGPK